MSAGWRRERGTSAGGRAGCLFLVLLFLLRRCLDWVFLVSELSNHSGQTFEGHSRKNKIDGTMRRLALWYKRNVEIICHCQKVSRHVFDLSV